jgi:putative two-component system response regulator
LPENEVQRQHRELLSRMKEITAARILVIDDDPDVVKMLENILRFDGFKHVQGMTNSRGALAQFVEYSPDLVLLDLSMPAPDGFHLMQLMASHIHPLLFLPIIVITGETGAQARKQALECGASDYITKPFTADEVCLRIRNQLRIHFQQQFLHEENLMLEREVIERTRELEDYELELKQSQIEVTVRLARAAEHRDDDTGQHTQRVGLTCFLIAQTLNMAPEAAALLRRSAPLHDVGKIGIPDAILRKPGKLNEEEWEVMQSHCHIGAGLLAGGRSALLQMAERVAISHHERWDGTGYPHRESGTAIPIEGRIVAVADVFDALTHDRPYKKAWSLDEALAEIHSQRGSQFDPDAVDAFMDLPHAQLM